MNPRRFAPRVSVVLPAARGSDVTAALEWLFRQTFTDFEVIVVNDESPDTADFEAALEPYAGRIHGIARAHGGAAAARNTGIREARGLYIAVLDVHDRWAPDFLQRQVSHLARNPHCDVVYCDALDAVGRRRMQTAPSRGAVTLHSLIAQRCTVVTSTVVARRRLFQAAGLFDDTLRSGHDFDLWLHMSHRGATIQYHRAVLAARCATADALTLDSLEGLQRTIAVLERFGRRRDLNRDTRALVRSRLMELVDRIEVEQGKRRILEGNFAAARYHLGASRHQPLKLRVARAGLRVAPSLVRSWCLWPLALG